MTQQNVLPQDSKRESGRTAQDTNIQVAQLVAQIVKTTLGPKGMDKLLVDHLGDTTVTNDGATILKEMTIEHPVGKMLVDIARTQEIEVGDGTTSTVVIAGELLKRAQELTRKKVHPTLIAKGFKLASDKAIEILQNIAVDLKKLNKEEYREVLKNISKTAMTGKGSEENKDHLSDLAVDSILKIRDKNKINLDNIKIEKKTGGTIKDSILIDGMVINKQKCHHNMVSCVNDAKIAIIDAPLETQTLDMDAKINISNPADMQNFLNSQSESLEGMAKLIAESGANVLICSRNIDEDIVHHLIKKNIFAIKRLGKEDIESLSNATGAKIVTNVKDLTSSDLGTAKIVEERQIGEDNMVFVEGCSNPKTLTILVRGSAVQITDEIKRALEDAVGDLASIVRTDKAVGGAGATEIILRDELIKFSKQHTGRLQLAIKAFAESLDVIPEVLADNAGLDPIDIMTEINAVIENKSIKWPGIDVFKGEVIDSWEYGVIEPLQIKTQAITSAAEVAIMVLRIDDVIAIMHNPDQEKAQRVAMQG